MDVSKNREVNSLTRVYSNYAYCIFNLRITGKLTLNEHISTIMFHIIGNILVSISKDFLDRETRGGAGCECFIPFRLQYVCKMEYSWEYNRQYGGVGVNIQVLETSKSNVNYWYHGVGRGYAFGPDAIR